MIVTNACAEIGQSKVLHIDLTDIKESFIDNLEIEIFPNPSNGKFYLKANTWIDHDLAIEVIDMEGRKLYSDMIRNLNPGDNYQIDLDDLQNGIYILVVTGENFTSKFKMIKN